MSDEDRIEIKDVRDAAALIAKTSAETLEAIDPPEDEDDSQGWTVDRKRLELLQEKWRDVEESADLLNDVATELESLYEAVDHHDEEKAEIEKERDEAQEIFAEGGGDLDFLIRELFRRGATFAEIAPELRSGEAQSVVRRFSHEASRPQVQEVQEESRRLFTTKKRARSKKA